MLIWKRSILKGKDTSSNTLARSWSGMQESSAIEVPTHRKPPTMAKLFTDPKQERYTVNTFSLYSTDDGTQFQHSKYSWIRNNLKYHGETNIVKVGKNSLTASMIWQQFRRLKAKFVDAETHEWLSNTSNFYINNFNLYVILSCKFWSLCNLILCTSKLLL